MGYFCMVGSGQSPIEGGKCDTVLTLENTVLSHLTHVSHPDDDTL